MSHIWFQKLLAYPLKAKSWGINQQHNLSGSETKVASKYIVPIRQISRVKKPGPIEIIRLTVLLL